MSRNGKDTPGALLVVGVTRSGTSFLHRLLNVHPSIRLAYESKVLTEGWQEYKRLPPAPSPERFTRYLETLAALDTEETLNEWLVSIWRTQRDALFPVPTGGRGLRVPRRAGIPGERPTSVVGQQDVAGRDGPDRP